MAQVKEYLEVTRWSLMERNGFFLKALEELIYLYPYKRF